MSMRTFDRAALIALLIVTACDEQNALPPPDPKAPDTVPCRLGTATAMAPLCRRENEGDRIVIRHPDGGFRRFVVVDDGRGIVTADGADAAKVEVLDKGRIRVIVGNDAYELPATFVTRP
ncbi:hypothetical protein [Sphingobium algorifonticola]|uniref:Lipoprotein n=1 Tax=Sphingobium algorifonticola TaxID=2008318 RepID=A0A437J741_9SPHN|nr:hypothetical protein [Sphingobium algorifonticola]RVT40826.1 hypothetical protein ENE74_10135 [Sphingobium algorifonticola]